MTLRFAIVAAAFFSGCSFLIPRSFADERDPFELVETLMGSDSIAQSDATAQLTKSGRGAHPALIDRYRSLASLGDAALLPSATRILRVFELQGEGAVPAIPFLLIAPDLFFDFVSVEEPGVELEDQWKDLFQTAIRALGSTGKEGMERLLRASVAGELTTTGDLITDRLWTIEPQGAVEFRALAEAFHGERGPDHRDCRRSAAILLGNVVGPSAGEAARLVAAEFPKFDLEERLRTVRQLGRMLPGSMSILLSTYDDPDPLVRREVIQSMSAAMWMHRTGHGGDYDAAAHWAGYWSDESREFETIRVVADLGGLILVRGLAEERADLRCLSAYVLFKLGRATSDVAGSLRAATDDPDEGVRYWASQALARRSAGRFGRLRLLVRARPPIESREIATLWQKFESAKGWKYDPKSHFVSLPAGPDLQYGIARDLIDASLDELLAAATSDDLAASASAARKLEALEERVATHVRYLCRAVIDGWYDTDEEWLEDRAVIYLGRLGDAALPEISWEFLRDPRWPFGYFVFDHLGVLLRQRGTSALPILAEGLEHPWPEAQQVSGAVAAELSADARPLAELIFAAWRRFDRDLYDEPPLSEVTEDTIVGLGAAILPELERALDEPYSRQRIMAARAILRIDAAGPAIRKRAEEVVK